MSRIVAVTPVVPASVYPQSVITEALIPLLSDDPGRAAVIRRIHGSSKIDQRHTALPLEEYDGLLGFDVSNDAFIRVGAELGTAAVSAALESSGIAPDDVSLLLFTTVTGVSAPSIDAAVVERVGLPRTVKRWPSFGLGCVAGAGGVARVDDYLAGHPDEVAVLLAVELCSLTVQRGDSSMANVVASGLFGDGAAAVVMVGDARAARMGIPGFDVIGARSSLYEDTDDVLGWDVGGTGFRIVLGAGVPTTIETNAAPDVRAVLAEAQLTQDDVDAWVMHPGGPKVLEAFSAGLGLPDGALQRSWHVMSRVGNLSSAAVLHVLAEVIADAPEPDSTALMFALGPGVSAETVLLRWSV